MSVSNVQLECFDRIHIVAIVLNGFLLFTFSGLAQLGAEFVKYYVEAINHLDPLLAQLSQPGQYLILAPGFLLNVGVGGLLSRWRRPGTR